MEKSEAAEIAVLLIGMNLLLTMFFDAYPFLREDISILPLLSSMEPMNWISGGRISDAHAHRYGESRSNCYVGGK